MAATTTTAASSVHVIDFSQASASALNPLSSRVRQFIHDELQKGLSNPDIKSLILTGGAHQFSAGADLTEFASISGSLQNTNKGKPSSSTPLSLIDVVQALEDSPKPIVCAIAGTCLGGGLELALACHYRVVLNLKSTKLGLPEVHVGVIPGAGGTQRLPKLVGLQTACQMILTGAPLNATRAHKAKLVDDLAESPKQLMEKAVQWAKWAEVLPVTAKRRLGRDMLHESAPVAHNILQQAQLALPKQGVDGWHAALRALRASYLPLEQGMEVEKAAFLETLLSSQGQARRHAFFAERQAQKLVHPELAAQLKREHPLLQQQHNPVKAAVIGAGTMGTGIAMVLLRSGFLVTLVDVQEGPLKKGLANIQRSYESQVKRKKMKPQVAESLLKRLDSSTRLQDLSQCQLVVEAVVENLQVKQSIFRTLDQVTPASCVLLSNTSTLDVDRMASVLKPERQEWFLGWHFFSPAHVMKLVEVVRGSRSSPQAVTLMQLLSKKVGKIGVVVGNCDGFCGNRLLRPYSLESAYLVEQGAASIQQVDDAVSELGVALGPFTMGDLAGNDVGYNIRIERGWTKDSKNYSPQKRPARYSEIADVMVKDLGRVGQKAGKGWYDYHPSVGEGRTPLHSKEMEQLIQTHLSRNKDRAVTPASAEEIVRRCFFPLVNEGFKCLEEGIALRPSDIDIVYIFGYGWPAWRGGPMYWADHQVGLPTVLSWLELMNKESPTTDHFVPSALLVECVKRGVKVEELYRQKEKTLRSKL